MCQNGIFYETSVTNALIYAYQTNDTSKFFFFLNWNSLYIHIYIYRERERLWMAINRVWSSWKGCSSNVNTKVCVQSPVKEGMVVSVFSNIIEIIVSDQREKFLHPYHFTLKFIQLLSVASCNNQEWEMWI